MISQADGGEDGNEDAINMRDESPTNNGDNRGAAGRADVSGRMSGELQ
jgi:hypothetical protein